MEDRVNRLIKNCDQRRNRSKHREETATNHGARKRRLRKQTGGCSQAASNRDTYVHTYRASLMDITNLGNLLHRRLFDVNPAQLDKKRSTTTTVEDYEQKSVVVVVTLAKNKCSTLNT
jgi:hypothetical protein